MTALWRRFALRRFAAARRGSVGTFMVVLTPLLLTAVAVGVEANTARQQQIKLQSAVDAAALAAAAFLTLELTEDTAALRKQRAMGVFDSYVDQLDNLDLQDVAYADDDPQYTVSATATYQSLMGGVLSFGAMDYTVTATAERAPRPTELALALDTTNSMFFGGRWERSSDAFEALLQQLSSGVEDRRDFVASYWPFSDRVRLPERFRNWGDGTPPSDWNGCFMPREQPESAFPFALTDDLPTRAPFQFSADSTEPATIDGHKTMVCRNEIVPPTTDVSDIRAGFDAAVGGGTGRFDSPLAWAWRALSPEWRGRWGMDDYPRPKGDVVKIVLFLSDGYTNISNDQRMGPHFEFELDQSYNVASPEHLAHLVEICRKMADDGIQIAMISPPDSYAPMQAAMRSCATTPAHYHELETDGDLVGALEAVLSLLSGSVRLIR